MRVSEYGITKFRVTLIGNTPRFSVGELSFSSTRLLSALGIRMPMASKKGRSKSKKQEPTARELQAALDRVKAENGS